MRKTPDENDDKNNFGKKHDAPPDETYRKDFALPCHGRVAHARREPDGPGADKRAAGRGSTQAVCAAHKPTCAACECACSRACITGPTPKCRGSCRDAAARTGARF